MVASELTGYSNSHLDTLRALRDRFSEPLSRIISTPRASLV